MDKLCIGFSTLSFYGEIKKLIENIIYQEFRIPVTSTLLDTNFDKEEFKDNIDLLVLSGGEDISPTIHGDYTLKNGHYNTIRDSIDLKNLYLALKYNKLIFGICRGHQLIHASLGGKLNVDIENHPSKHLLYYPKDININENLKLDRVNSLHHQAVKYSAKELLTVAYFGGFSEMSFGKNSKIFTTQFHPEFMQNNLEYRDSNKKFAKIFIRFIQGKLNEIITNR